MNDQDGSIAVYSRKSKFTGKGESIGNQVELCKEYIRAHYGEAALETISVYEDEGFSGGNLNRPGFKKMMEAAREHKIRAIIVYRLDRISRSISDFSGLIEELSCLDIAFVSIREQFDTGTPMGRAMMYIASVFSQLERETIAERIRDNMHELAKTGRWLGGTTPLGYGSEAVKTVTIDGKSRKACRLKLIPKEEEIVRTIFTLYEETGSQTLTEAELIKRGIKTRNGKFFSRFAIRAILQNPVYATADEDAYKYFVKAGSSLFQNRDAFDSVHGIMAYNRTRQEKDRTTEYLPADQWIVAVGQHPGIVPGFEWVRVQESLELNKSKSYHRSRSNEALLTGLLYCSCGSRMYPKIGRGRTADGKPEFTYVCKMKERSRRAVCNGRNVHGICLDCAVIDQLKRMEENRTVFVSRLEQSRRYYSGKRTGFEEQLTAMRREKADMEKKIEGLVDSLVDLGDGAVRTCAVNRIEQLNMECAGIEFRIRELENQTFHQALNETEFDAARRLLSEFRGSVDSMNTEQKRAALRTIVRKVVWDGENAHVVLSGAQEPKQTKTHWGEDSK